MGTDRGKGTFKVPADKAERRLTVTYCPISKLKLNPKNPRAHSPKQIRQIARSIETFTFLVPVLVDGQGNVLAGHGRIQAALLLGWTEVPVIFVDHLSENQARAFMIADNRLTENSVWDERLLAQHMKELSKLELDFSLEVTGFEMGEIDIIIEGLTAAALMVTIPPMPCPSKRDQPLHAWRPWLLGRQWSPLRGLAGRRLVPGSDARTKRARWRSLILHSTSRSGARQWFGNDSPP